MAYVCACFVRSFNALLLAPIVAKSWGNPINFFYFWLCSLLPRRRFLLESHHSWPCPIPLIDLRKESFSQSLLSSNQISRCFHWGLTRPISVITFSPLGITTYLLTYVVVYQYITNDVYYFYTLLRLYVWKYWALEFKIVYILLLLQFISQL